MIAHHIVRDFISILTELFCYTLRIETYLEEESFSWNTLQYSTVVEPLNGMFLRTPYNAESRIRITPPIGFLLHGVFHRGNPPTLFFLSSLPFFSRDKPTWCHRSEWRERHVGAVWCHRHACLWCAETTSLIGNLPFQHCGFDH